MERYSVSTGAPKALRGGGGEGMERASLQGGSSSQKTDGEQDNTATSQQTSPIVAPVAVPQGRGTRMSDERSPSTCFGVYNTGFASGNNVGLSFRHIFGVKPNVKQALHYAEADTVVYPAGHHVVLYTCSTKNQRFLTGTEEALGSTCLAMSGNRRFLAVGEQGSQRALVTIYDLLTNKRKKSLAFIDCLSESFVSVAFSTDSKMLLALGGPPDWCLISWAWEKPKVVATYKISSFKEIRFCECSYHPLDSNILCAIGDGVSRLLKFQDGGLRVLQNHLLKREGYSYTSHTWLENGYLVAGTENGELLLYDSNGDFKGSLASAPGSAGSILCIEATSRGFICGGGDASVHVFEFVDDEQSYRKTMELKVEHQTPGAQVTSLAVAPHEDNLCVCLSTCQLFQISLRQQTNKGKDDLPGINYLHTAFHVGPILGMDVCELKPLVVTCGADKSIRVWNFVDNSIEICKFYAEDVYSVAFHPSGYHVLAGFSDKLRLLNLLHEDLSTMKEFVIKGCRECRFSNGGHLFAAAHSNLIQVYETYTHKSLVTLRGHNSKVRSLYWTPDDSILISAGMDGAVYEYKVCSDCVRLTDWVQKGVNFSSVLAYPKSKDSPHNTMLAVGSDNTLKELSNCLLVKEYEAGATLSCVAMSKRSCAIFAGTADPGCPGQIRCYAFPLTGEYLRYQCHSSGVQRICVSKDGSLLISCGLDGTLCICGLTTKMKVIEEEDVSAHEYSDEVLVTRAYIRDKQTQLIDLERQVEDLTNQMEFQLRNRETQHREQLLQVEERYNYQLEQERTKYDILREEKQEQEQLYTEQEKEREENHAATLQQMETNFQNKMTVEVARYHKVVSERERDKKESETRLQQAKDEFTTKLANVTTDLEEAEKKAVEERDTLQQQKDLALKTHQELLRQIEEDADREIEELKDMYETKLAQEGAEKVRLRGQAGIHRKRHEDLKEQMELLREDLKQKEEVAQRFRSEIEKLLSDREAVLKELQERDRTIGEKEQRIYELKKHNQELEKFKFVLDHKIRELKATIDPKDKHIVDMQKQIQAMDAELVDYHRQHKLSTLEVAQLKLKQRALQDEIVEQRQKLAICAHQAGRMKTDLYDCAQHLQDPKQLKESLTRLYQKYIINGNNNGSNSSNGSGSRRKANDDVDVDILKELHRQRDYLEKSVESLKRRLAKDAEVHRQDNIKLMQENASLICEINDLRKEVNTLRMEKQEARIHGALAAHSKVAHAKDKKGDWTKKVQQQSGDVGTAATIGSPTGVGGGEVTGLAGAQTGSAGPSSVRSNGMNRRSSPAGKRQTDDETQQYNMQHQQASLHGQPAKFHSTLHSFTVSGITPSAKPSSPTASQHHSSAATTVVRTPRKGSCNKPSPFISKSTKTEVEQANHAETYVGGGVGMDEPTDNHGVAAAAATSESGEEYSKSPPPSPHTNLDTENPDDRQKQPQTGWEEYEPVEQQQHDTASLDDPQKQPETGLEHEPVEQQQPQADTPRSDPTHGEDEADHHENLVGAPLTHSEPEQQHDDASNFVSSKDGQGLSTEERDSDKEEREEQQ